MPSLADCATGGDIAISDRAGGRPAFGQAASSHNRITARRPRRATDDRDGRRAAAGLKSVFKLREGREKRAMLSAPPRDGHENLPVREQLVDLVREMFEQRMPVHQGTSFWI